MNNYQLQQAKQRHLRIKRHAELIGKTNAEWAAISSNPALFNRVWRHMLNLPADDMPPPASMR